MISSMTGFGTADGMVGAARVSVEARSVNHRFFTPTIKVPSAFSKWEPDVREILRKWVFRGHVTLFARIGSEPGSEVPLIDETKLTRYLTELSRLQKRHSIPGELDIAAVLRLPMLFSPSPDEADSGSLEELSAIVSKAVGDLVLMRHAEGGQLQRYLEERLVELRKVLARIAERAPRRQKEQHARLRSSVEQLLAGRSLDDARIAQEIAILAEKLDVEEELDRFNGHIEAFGDTIRGAQSEPVGKRLGFLLQEMVREANTLGSKANDSAILSDVILVKEELERMREQVENVE